MSLKFRFVCATRATREEFAAKSALGLSLALFRSYSFLELRLFPSNTSGLPLVYNTALREAATDPAILVFAHDDIYLCDFFWPMRLMTALDSFQIVGLAGNRRRVPGQPAWAFVDPSFTWDKPENLSGIVGHGAGFPPESLSFFGTPGVEVKLLDGLLLAARSEILLARGVAFDERFDFHFYDMDLCRQAEARNLRMGTCSISVIHQSPGKFGTPQWQKAYGQYLEKWGS